VEMVHKNELDHAQTLHLLTVVKSAVDRSSILEIAKSRNAQSMVVCLNGVRTLLAQRHAVKEPNHEQELAQTQHLLSVEMLALEH